MNDEEKKAIEYFENELKVHWIESNFTISDRQNLRIALNLIEKQDKIINEMAKYIAETDVTEQMCPKCKYRNVECTLEQCIEKVIEYFEKKVGE